MDRKKHRFTMRTRMVTFCLVIALSALILQTILYGYTSSTLIYRQAKEENLRILENMQDELHGYVRSVENGMIGLYNEKEFIKELRQNLPAETLHEHWHRLAYNIGSENFDTSAGVVALYLYTDEHEIVSTYRKAMTPKHNYPLDIYDGTQETNAQIVKDYVDSDDAVMMISSYYNEYRGKDLVRFVLKIYQMNTLSKKIGYVVCDVDSKIFQYLMNKYTTSDDTYIWLQPTGDRAVTSIGNLSEKDGKYYQGVMEKIQGGRRSDRFRD